MAAFTILALPRMIAMATEERISRTMSARANTGL
jgi:hypothetical protein